MPTLVISEVLCFVAVGLPIIISEKRKSKPPTGFVVAYGLSQLVVMSNIDRISKGLGGH